MNDVSRVPEGTEPVVTANAYLQIVASANEPDYTVANVRPKESSAVGLSLLVTRVHVEVEFLLSCALIINVWERVVNCLLFCDFITALRYLGRMGRPTRFRSPHQEQSYRRLHLIL